jgi:hypothetical protein
MQLAIRDINFISSVMKRPPVACFDAFSLPLCFVLRRPFFFGLLAHGNCELWMRVIDIFLNRPH